MAAGNQQQIGEGDVVGESRAQGMAFEMVDRVERLVVHGRDRLGHGDTDDNAADQARPGGRGDAVEIGEADPGLAHGGFDQRAEMLQMRAGGDFGHHATVWLVLVELGEQRLGQHPAPVVDHGGGRFVAARFDAQDNHRGAIMAA